VDDVINVIRRGSARMPGFGDIGESGRDGHRTLPHDGEAKEASALRSAIRASG